MNSTHCPPALRLVCRLRGPVLALALVAAAVAAAPAVQAAGALEAGFANPPDQSKPWCYWYWISDHLSKDGITRDLEAMARVGIGEALIGNIHLDDVPAGNVKVLTPEWWALVEHAIREGGRVGVNIGMFNCPGWSQSGGPWIQTTEAMRHLATAEMRVTGPQHFAGVLPAPKEPFQDVAMLAFPAPRQDASTMCPWGRTTCWRGMPIATTGRRWPITPARISPGRRSSPVIMKRSGSTVSLWRDASRPSMASKSVELPSRSRLENAGWLVLRTHHSAEA